MAYETAVVRAACTATSTDFEVAGFGTPSAAMVVITRATANDAAKDDLLVGVGFFDGSTEHCHCLVDEHGQDTTDSDRAVHTGKLVYLLDTDAAVMASGDASWATDGLTITWDSNPVEAYLATVYLWNSDWSANVGAVATNATQGLTADYTSSSFVPEQMIGLHRMRSDLGTPGTNPNGFLGIGFADNGSGITQYSALMKSNNNKGTSDLGSSVTNQYFAVNQAATWGAEVTAFIDNGASSGFTVTTRLSSSDEQLVFLLLSSGGNKSHSLYDWQAPIAVPNDSTVADLGFTPDATIAVLTDMETWDTAFTNARAGSMAISVHDGTTQICNSWASEDNADTSNTQCMSADAFLDKPADDGIAGVPGHAGTAAIDSDGFTFSYTSAPTAGGRRSFGLTWGDAAAVVSDALRFRNGPGLRNRHMNRL